MEHDALGEVPVPADKLWGAQTQRSFQNFRIGHDRMPEQVIFAFAVLKKAAALANRELGKLDEARCKIICDVCDEILAGKLSAEFPLSVWQTGSGTQSNMNVNEVVANRGNQLAGQKILHPNDTVNMSQSSNDTFPTAMHIAAVTALQTELLPALRTLIDTCRRLEQQNEGIIKIGRTHLQDATPIAFSQEISGWRGMLENSLAQVKSSCEGLYRLALGGTAVGTGLNAPKGFAELAARKAAELTGFPFATDPNKFHALTAKDDLAFSHGALKALAANLMKIANDVRWLASGPRCGIGEIRIPENEPGSSIMPGKVNPVIPEVVNQVAFRVIGNDLTVTIASEAGQLELNVMEPIIVHCLFESIEMLINAMNTLREKCIAGITANEEVCRRMVFNSIGLVTALNPYLGYETSSMLAKEALKTGKGIYDLVLEHKLMSEEELHKVLQPENMVHPRKKIGE